MSKNKRTKDRKVIIDGTVALMGIAENSNDPETVTNAKKAVVMMFDIFDLDRNDFEGVKNPRKL